MPNENVSSFRHKSNGNVQRSTSTERASGAAEADLFVEICGNESDHGGLLSVCIRLRCFSSHAAAFVGSVDIMPSF